MKEFAILKAAVFALYMRELKTRFGKYRLGMLWLLLEPVTHIAVLMAIMGFTMKTFMPTVDYVTFLVLGLTVWFIFADLVQKLMDALDSNSGLLFYRRVKPIDTLLARTVLELAIRVIVTFILWVALFALDRNILLQNPLMFGWVIVLTILFSFGTALTIAMLTVIYPETKKIVPMLMRPLYFISGIFVPIYVIPEDWRIYLVWNPMLHAIELAHSYYMPAYQTNYVSLNYLAMSALTMTFLGLWLYRKNKFRMVP